jgi:hypothetical protein
MLRFKRWGPDNHLIFLPLICKSLPSERLRGTKTRFFFGTFLFLYIRFCHVYIILRFRRFCCG